MQLFKKNPPSWIYGLLATAVIIASALILNFYGRDWWCRCGYVKLWDGVLNGLYDAQHFSDYYTFSHIIHGFAFFGILWLIARRLPLGLRFVLAVVMEEAWELFENSNFMIQRYRDTTIANAYQGDSILNSTSDVVFMSLGFLLAWKLPVWMSIVLIIAMEVIVGFFIRDNLTLNIIMLLYPVQVIKKWQMGL
ncbi:MAG: hypothetical protein US74_C0021G0015 [Parcubacteria group bacterium GW2011_GWA2_38_13]|nr:MAG: hypothetical protein US74_C0021G0015 [Parcubacteria group bacterium GW2011_GWA2_38_13]